jgi:SAM-dependent methyltransferase
MEVLSFCPACKSSSLQKFISVKDFSISQEIFQTQICETCSLVFTNPRPGKNEIAPYYEGDVYISHSDSKKGLINRVYHLVREQALKSKLSLINSLKPENKSLLDVGAGTGAFLNFMKKNAWEVEGVEPVESVRNKVLTQGLNVFDEAYLKNSGKKYDIITLWHVLEHVHTLEERISELHNLIKDSGYIIIAVPNHSSYDRKHYREFWAAYDVPRHLYHFSDESLIPLFKKSGLKLVKKEPMIFDSFYVSLLSEKYKGKTNYIKSLWVGLKSNLSGKQTGNYSSNIYIFAKDKNSNF